MEVLQSNSPNFFLQKKQGKKEELFAIISMICLEFLNKYSPNDFNKSSALNFAEDVLEQRLDWKIEDVKYYFKFAKEQLILTGIIGNRITLLKLLEWIGMYEESKLIVKEAKIKSAVYEDKTPVTDKCIPMPDYVKETIAKIGRDKKHPAPHSEKQMNDAYKIATQSLQYKQLTDQWIKEFDALPRCEGLADRAQYNGNYMTINQYLEYKMSHAIL